MNMNNNWHSGVIKCLKKKDILIDKVARWEQSNYAPTLSSVQKWAEEFKGEGIVFIDYLQNWRYKMHCMENIMASCESQWPGKLKKGGLVHQDNAPALCSKPARWWWWGGVHGHAHCNHREPNTSIINSSTHQLRTLWTLPSSQTTLDLVDSILDLMWQRHIA